MKLTADEALPLLWDNGKDIHNIGPGGIGATWDKEAAVEAVRSAVEILICDWRHHRLMVRAPSGRVSLFETDDSKVEDFLKVRGQTA